MDPNAPKIVVRIDKRTGNTSVAGENFKGPACAAASEAIRKAIGAVGDNALEQKLAAWDELPEIEQSLEISQGNG